MKLPTRKANKFAFPLLLKLLYEIGDTMSASHIPSIRNGQMKRPPYRVPKVLDEIDEIEELRDFSRDLLPWEIEAMRMRNTHDRFCEMA